MTPWSLHNSNQMYICGTSKFIRDRDKDSQHYPPLSYMNLFTNSNQGATNIEENSLDVVPVFFVGFPCGTFFRGQYFPESGLMHIMIN